MHAIQENDLGCVWRNSQSDQQFIDRCPILNIDIAFACGAIAGKQFSKGGVKADFDLHQGLRSFFPAGEFFSKRKKKEKRVYSFKKSKRFDKQDLRISNPGYGPKKYSVLGLTRFIQTSRNLEPIQCRRHITYVENSFWRECAFILSSRTRLSRNNIGNLLAPLQFLVLFPSLGLEWSRSRQRVP